MKASRANMMILQGLRAQGDEYTVQTIMREVCPNPMTGKMRSCFKATMVWTGDLLQSPGELAFITEHDDHCGRKGLLTHHSGICAAIKSGQIQLHSTKAMIDKIGPIRYDDTAPWGAGLHKELVQS